VISSSAGLAVAARRPCEQIDPARIRTRVPAVESLPRSYDLVRNIGAKAIAGPRLESERGEHGPANR
jgi:hypothetical protein